MNSLRRFLKQLMIAAMTVAALISVASSEEIKDTVCEVHLQDGRIYRSARLDVQQVALCTKYGILKIPIDDLISIIRSTSSGEDEVATVKFVVTGELLVDEFSGHTPAEQFCFRKGEISQILFGFPASAAVGPEGPRFRILWFRDRRHHAESIHRVGDYGYSAAARIAEEIGAANIEVQDNYTLTSERLSQFDAIIFMNVESCETLSESERKTLRDFLAAGGSILVIGQQDRGSPLSREALFANSVSLPYGIEFTKGKAKSTKKLASHPITSGLKSVPGGGSVLKVRSPAQALAPADGNNVVLAISQHGKGRIVAVSDDSAFADLSLSIESPIAAFNESFFLEAREPKVKQSRLFFRNVLCWLLHLEAEQLQQD